jgi:hypothetical protein
MVNALRMVVIFAALLLPLSSCDILFNGVFPSDIGQATARTDLSNDIPAGEAPSFNLFVITSGGEEFVLLFSSLGFDSSHPYLIIMDPELKKQNVYSFDDLSNLDPVGFPFSGSYAMRDVAGNIMIGNIQFKASSGGLVPFKKFTTPALWGPSVSGGPSHLWNEANFRVNGSNLEYDEYDSGWITTASPFSWPMGAPSSSLQLRGIFTDPDSSSASDVLVFADDASSRYYFLRVSKDDVDTNPATSVFDSSKAPVVKKNLDGNSISYTRDGMAAYEYETRSWIRFSLDSADTVDSMYVGERTNNLRTAFSISGDYYCTWDPKSRVLTRYEKWW